MTTTNHDAPVVIDHTISAAGRLTIRLAAAELRLAGTDGDRVVVRTPTGTSLPDRVIIETTDDALTIREKESLGLTFGIGRKVVQLEIELPATAEVRVETISGWLDVQGLTGEQRYRTTSGETRLRAAAGEIELNTVSGDARIELADVAQLGVKSVSGDIAVSGGRLDSLRIGTTSGEVRVDSPLVGRDGHSIETLSGDVSIVATAGLRVQARTVSGDLTSDLPHRTEGRMGRRTLIVGDGSIELGFRSVSGDLWIHDGSGADGGPSSRSTPTERPAAPWHPAIPPMPAMPAMPVLPALPAVPGSTAAAVADDADPRGAERMAILRALENGELDVPTAMDRLAALDADGADGDEGPDGGVR